MNTDTFESGAAESCVILGRSVADGYVEYSLGGGETVEHESFLLTIAELSLAVLALLSGWRLLPVGPFAIYAVGLSWLLFLAALGFIITIRQARTPDAQQIDEADSA